MPRPMEADGPDRTEYGESRLEDDFQRQSWMDMGSGSESDDTGKLHFTIIIICLPPCPLGGVQGHLLGSNQSVVLDLGLHFNTTHLHPC